MGLEIKNLYNPTTQSFYNEGETPTGDYGVYLGGRALIASIQWMDDEWCVSIPHSDTTMYSSPDLDEAIEWAQENRKIIVDFFEDFWGMPAETANEEGYPATRI